MSKIYRVEENIVDFYKNIDAVSMHGSTDTQSATLQHTNTTGQQQRRPVTLPNTNQRQRQAKDEKEKKEQAPSAAGVLQQQLRFMPSGFIVIPTVCSGTAQDYIKCKNCKNRNVQKVASCLSSCDRVLSSWW